ncbi:hypothetical protein ABTF07_20370, partial [Acinetobacter baumannii]
VGVVVGAVLGIYMVVARFKVGMAALDQQSQGTPDTAEAEPTAPTDRQPDADSREIPPEPSARQTTSRGADA